MISTHSTQQTILIYDSAAQQLEDAVDILRANGFSVIYHLDDVLPDVKTDLVLTCAEHAGGAHGKAFTLLRKKLPHVPVLLVLHIRSLSVAIDFFRAGVADCLCAPYPAEELITRVEACLEPTKHGSHAQNETKAQAFNIEKADIVEPHENDDPVEVVGIIETSVAENIPADTLNAGCNLPTQNMPENLATAPALAETQNMGHPADHAPCGILMFSPQSDPSLSYANEAALRLLGVNELSEAQSALSNLASLQPLDKNSHELAPDRWPVALAQKEKATRSLDVGILRSDGTRIWVRIEATPRLENGHVTQIVSSLTNITEEFFEMKKLRERLASR